MYAALQVCRISDKKHTQYKNVGCENVLSENFITSY